MKTIIFIYCFACLRDRELTPCKTNEACLYYYYYDYYYFEGHLDSFAEPLTMDCGTLFGTSYSILLNEVKSLNHTRANRRSASGSNVPDQ